MRKVNQHTVAWHQVWDHGWTVDRQDVSAIWTEAQLALQKCMWDSPLSSDCIRRVCVVAVCDLSLKHVAAAIGRAGSKIKLRDGAVGDVNALAVADSRRLIVDVDAKHLVEAYPGEFSRVALACKPRNRCPEPFRDALQLFELEVALASLSSRNLGNREAYVSSELLKRQACTFTKVTDPRWRHSRTLPDGNSRSRANWQICIDSAFADWQKEIMTLHRYLEQHSLRPSQFANRIGVPASTITRLLRGERRPSLETLRKITAATDGQVKAEDFAVQHEAAE